MIIIDASLFAAWLLNEQDHGPTDAVWEAILPERIFVPVHWPNEVANALRRAVRTKRIRADEVRPIAERAREFGIGFAAPTSLDEIADLATAALEHGLSTYDMTYVRLADEYQCRLATIDRAMRNAAQRLNVRVLPELIGAMPTGSSPDIPSLATKLRAGDRATLARAITLVESKRADHQNQAHRLVQELLPETGRAARVGITGSPGVGKSTTIDALGTYLTGQGHKVAVLAVDPSSTRTGGSILGDKTRMARLANDERAFIRPSPAAGTLGGVAAKTRETMLICEAAGFDVILVETVGIGQSETAVADMTDFFLVLMLPGAGDELQGIKKGVVELADMIAVNKADGDNIKRARAAAGEYRAALHILTPRSPNWAPPVTTYSALTGDGIPALWEKVQAHRQQLTATGEFAARRREQQVKWMWAMLEDRIHLRLKTDAKLKTRLSAIEKSVAEGKLSLAIAVEEIASALGI